MSVKDILESLAIRALAALLIVASLLIVVLYTSAAPVPH